MKEPIKIFFCYAREDEALLNKLKAHLSPLQRQGLINVWHDRDISAGAEWEKEISKYLNAAQIIVLLVSPDFMNSDYCYGIEMNRALERHERDEALVIPIIVRPVYWKIASLSQLQVLPTDGKPLTDRYWHTLDDAFLNVIEGIQRAIETLSQPAKRGSDWTRGPSTNLQSPLVVTSKIIDVDYMATIDQSGRSVLVPASGHILRLTVEATDSRTAIIQNLRPIVYSRSEATGSLSLHFGIVTLRPFEVLLDENPPCLKPADPTGPNFPFKVGPGDPEVFDLKVLTSMGDVKWWLELSWTSSGQEGTLRVDLGGSPFRTMARPK
jgi:TIR domain